MIIPSIPQYIGHTPLLELYRLQKREGLPARILAKLECCNPTGSAKDRAALAMVQDAEERGLLVPGGTVIEPTSGNMGISLAAIAAVRGYRAVIVMPDSMSAERRRLIRAYGAELVLTPGAGGMSGAVVRAKELAAEIPNSFLPDQFRNTANAAAHYRTTGPEIWVDSGGNANIFVAGVGTGGTVTGAGRYLKERDPGIRVAAVEPAESPLLSAGRAGPHDIQGIGAGFLPEVLDISILDEVIAVTTEEAFSMGRKLAETEGILCGISSGAALHAAVQLARQPKNAGKTVVALLPDTGERYLSTPMFAL